MILKIIIPNFVILNGMERGMIASTKNHHLVEAFTYFLLLSCLNLVKKKVISDDVPILILEDQFGVTNKNLSLDIPNSHFDILTLISIFLNTIFKTFNVLSVRFNIIKNAEFSISPCCAFFKTQSPPFFSRIFGTQLVPSSGD